MSQGCWTCRGTSSAKLIQTLICAHILLDRKVRCDLGVPTCGNCVRSQRQCLGYGFRLAWPRNGNKKRLVIYAPASSVRKVDTGRPKDFAFVNVSSHDVQLNYDSYADQPKEKLAIQPLPTARVVSFALLDERATLLLDYCQYRNR